MIKAIIRPIKYKATDAHFPWPEEVIGIEVEAELYDSGDIFFAHVTQRGLGIARWDVMHGEAELVCILDDEIEVCGECGSEL